MDRLCPVRFLRLRISQGVTEGVVEVELPAITESFSVAKGERVVFTFAGLAKIRAADPATVLME